MFKSIAKDFLSGTIVFLVALPLCLGIAIASDADPIAGLISGIVGGIVVGLASGSATSVSGPAAGLTAIVAAQIAGLGNYETFLTAVVLAGVMQIGFGLLKAGALSAFFPSSVIKGLLAAIGIILLFKQLPLLFGYSKDMGLEFGHAEALVDYEQHPHSAEDFSHPVGDIIVSFYRAMSDLIRHEEGFQFGAMTVGLFSLVFLIVWDKIPRLKKSLVPAPLLVVILGSGLGWLLTKIGGNWDITHQQLVDVPKAESVSAFFGMLKRPDFSQLTNMSVYIGAITIAVVASLETLLNLDAVDKLDKKQRISPPNRELFAQGLGNMTAGMLGGIPVTSVIIRGSVNVNAGAETKLSGIVHGVLLLGCVLLIPQILQMIPLSCLAAILLLTGFKLASPELFKQMLSEGRYQFLPFLFTLVAIVLTDLLVGICIGLVLSLLFILNSNLRRPVRRIHEKHVDGDLLHIELGNQVSFLNRASLEIAMREAPRGSRLLIDARRTDYIDPDVLSLIRDFRDKTAPALGIKVRLAGFREKYLFNSQVDCVDFSVPELREKLQPDQVLQILADGNKRYVEGHPLDRALLRNVTPLADSSKAIAVIITGIDSRTPVELIFDLGLGDAFVIRIPGVVIGPRAIGGVEYSVAVGGAKLVVVLGHADSSLLSLAIHNAYSPDNMAAMAGCAQLEEVLVKLAASIEQSEAIQFPSLTPQAQKDCMQTIARRHVARTVEQLVAESPALKKLVDAGQVKVVGAVYESAGGIVRFLD
ncbi:MAG: bifunctional SulP family inorganic anion transporter/carbonic anhydrase [Pirellulaceae bacterium]|nr:bifunctional SulP family inorganic anion transporter/carbonic anhydrase [Pirellulaceae bacterium]